MQTSLSTTTPITHAAATSSREGGTGLKVINGLCAVVHAARLAGTGRKTMCKRSQPNRRFGSDPRGPFHAPPCRDAPALGELIGRHHK